MSLHRQCFKQKPLIIVVALIFVFFRGGGLLEKSPSVRFSLHLVMFQFELVCDQKDMSDISSSLWFVGVLVGSVLFGYVADRCVYY